MAIFLGTREREKSKVEKEAQLRKKVRGLMF